MTQFKKVVFLDFMLCLCLPVSVSLSLAAKLGCKLNYVVAVDFEFLIFLPQPHQCSHDRFQACWMNTLPAEQYPERLMSDLRKLLRKNNVKQRQGDRRKPGKPSFWGLPYPLVKNTGVSCSEPPHRLQNFFRVADIRVDTFTIKKASTNPPGLGDTNIHLFFLKGVGVLSVSQHSEIIELDL